MWREEYKKKKFYWGLKPVPRLKKVIKYAPTGEALDIGAGEGRNSIFLAKNSFKVTAIDLIPEGLKKLAHFAKEHNLNISTKVIDIRKFKFPTDKYSLIISIAAIDFLKKSEIDKIIKRIKKSLIRGGVLYLSVFSTNDPLFYKIKELNLEPIEKNTFYLPKGKFYRHFFTRNELKNYFKDFEIILLKSRSIRDMSHDKPHFHHIIELIAKKV